MSYFQPPGVIQPLHVVRLRMPPRGQPQSVHQIFANHIGKTPTINDQLARFLLDLTLREVENNS